GSKSLVRKGWVSPELLARETRLGVLEETSPPSAQDATIFVDLVPSSRKCPQAGGRRVCVQSCGTRGLREKGVIPVEGDSHPHRHIGERLLFGSQPLRVDDRFRPVDR